jgi:hypothetical protein
MHFSGRCGTSMQVRLSLFALRPEPTISCLIPEPEQITEETEEISIGVKWSSANNYGSIVHFMDQGFLVCLSPNMK